MRPISVLLTNNALALRGGSETYVRDVALALLHRGHRPTVFSLVHGDAAAELRRATIPVLDDVTRLGEVPDVIHGHHHLETLIATLAFPTAPVVNFCHGWVPWEEMPLHHPAVRRYVAVDEACADRLIREQGLSPDQVEVLLNFVDLDRFQPRPPLPERPARALIMSNSATADGYARAVREACESAGIAVDICGAAAGNAVAAPEALFAGYDLVFAKGRTALESLAVGCATILSDVAGAGALVTPDNFDVLRARNFGIRELRQRHDVSWYGAQLALYDARRAAQVCARVRAEADMEPAIGRLLEIYATAMASPPGPGDPSRAAAMHCSRIAPPLKQAHALSGQLTRLTHELESAHADLDAQVRTGKEQVSAGRALQARIDALLAESSRREQELQALALEHSTAVVEHSTAAREFHLRIEALLADARRHEQRIDQLEQDSAAVAQNLQLRIDTLLAEAGQRQRALDHSGGQLELSRARVATLDHELAAFRSLPTLRLRDAALRAPLLGPVLQWTARRIARRLRRTSVRRVAEGPY